MKIGNYEKHPSWGWMGPPPQAVKDAGWAYGRRWNDLSEKIDAAARLPPGMGRMKALRKIDWEKERLIIECETNRRNV